MLCVEPDQFGQIVLSTASVCEFVLIKGDDFLASASLTAPDIAESFAWGFGVVISLWALSYAVNF